MIVVSNTSPLNYLILIGLARILPDLYDSIIIPEAVFSELQSAGAPPEVRAWSANLPGWIEVRQTQTALKELKLGAGEREAIALAVELEADVLLVDDRKARDEARKRRLNVVGTLAIAVTAARQGLIELSTTVQQLEQTTFRASPELIQSILDQARKDR